MAFREIAKGLKLPQGASERYRKLEALGRMLTGELYDDIRFPFEQEKYNSEHIPLRDRRPSVDLNLPYEITQDTLSELFGDEQFPTVSVLNGHKQDDTATEEMASLMNELGMEDVLTEAYEEGVIGSVGIILKRADNGLPFYMILPGKWCEPAYRSQNSNELVALVVTYPVDRKTTEKEFPEVVKEDQGENYWYRYIVGPHETVDYLPMSEMRFAHLGEKDSQGNTIEFVQREKTVHGFNGKVPAMFIKNLGGKTRDIDGQCLWWPIRNLCIEIDFTLSQCGRGLRYCADPMLFIKRGDMMSQDIDVSSTPGNQKPAGGMATNVGRGGEMVRGATQVLVGTGKDSDAKLLEISANGMKEEREFTKDLREYALEVVGGLKSRAEHMKGAPSGRAIDKGLKPLRRLVRRQRRPYGDGLLIGLMVLTLYGFQIGVFDDYTLTADPSKIPLDSRLVNDWPNDDVLQGDELFQHVQGLQMAAGGSPQNPKELIDPLVIGAKLAADLGFHQPFGIIKGTGEAETPSDSAIVKP